MKIKSTLPAKRSFVSAVIWCISYLISIYVVTRLELSKTTALIISIIPIVTFAAFVYFYIKGIGAMDEVKQRVQFEAVVIAFSLSLLLVMALFLIGLAIEIDYDYFGYKFMVLYFILFYYIGYILSKKKYG